MTAILRPFALLARSLWILVVFFMAWCRYLGLRMETYVREGFIDSERRDGLRGEVLADALQRLGATYVKFGQILSTRPDLFGPGYTNALSRLQDQVAPETFEEIEKVLETELGRARKRLIVDPEPLAAASVAQVHRAVLDGEHPVVVKVQRPSAGAQVDRDLVLMGIGARVLNLLPSLRLLSMPGAVERFGKAMKDQLDFGLEAEHNRRFARNFADTEGVRVPDLYDELCTRRVLTMEAIAGVRATEVESVSANRKAIARRGLDAILQMVFGDGFVHADLHPGNIFLTDRGEVVLIDLGLVAEIDDEFRGPWIQTFVALTAQDGALAARLFYSYAPTVGPNIDYPLYESQVQERFDALKGKPMHELEASKVLMGMMNVLRAHHIQVDPVFTVVNLAMLVAEGLGKQLDPDLDLIALAGPYLVKALAEAPPALTPRREPPTAASPEEPAPKPTLRS